MPFPTPMSAFVKVARTPHFVFSLAHIFVEMARGEPGECTFPGMEARPPPAPQEVGAQGTARHQDPPQDQRLILVSEAQHVECSLA